jgi:hypothetical protein
LSARAIVLPAAALAVVLVLLAVQLASGGASFVPTPPPSACTTRPLPARSKDLTPVIEDVVLGGVQRAACTLGVSRERLLLALPSGPDRRLLADERGQTEQGLERALKNGMIAEVSRLSSAGRLPATSALLDTYASQLGLSGLEATALKSVPSGVIDSLLPTRDVLVRAIDGLDVGQLLATLNEPGGLEPALRAAIQSAAIAEAKARILQQLPSSLQGLLGG